MRSHNLRSSLANSSSGGDSGGSGGGSGGDDLTTNFVEFSNRAIDSTTYMGSGSDYNGPYDVAQVQTDFSGTGRIYIGQKNTSVTSYRNDVAVAGVQILSGSTLVKSWIFNTSSGGTGSGWKTLNLQLSGSNNTGYMMTPDTAHNLAYYTMSSSGHNEDRWTFASGTGSSHTGAADGIGDTYKLSADGGSSTIATVGDGEISQTSGAYYAYRETSGSANHSGCIMRSPEYTFSGGEYIRIIHCLAGGSGALMDPDDTLYIGVEGGPSGTTSKVLELDANDYSGSGNWLDTSGSGNHGVPTSSSSGLTWVNDGNADYWSFGSGQNSFVFSNAMFDASSDHTFSLWVRMDLTDNYHTFTSNYAINGGLSYRYKAAATESAIGLQLLSSNQTEVGTFPDSGSLSTNTIYHFTFVRYGDGFSCYINGVRQNPSNNNTIGGLFIDTTSVSFQTTNNLGANKGGYDSLYGRLYHVEAYSAARTDSQVLASFNALKSRYGY